jgi:hypothetical protein
MTGGRLSFTEWVNAVFEIPYTLGSIMAKQDELRAQVASLQADLDAEQEQVRLRHEQQLVVIGNLTAQIEQLIANPDIATDITDALTAIRDDLRGTIPDDVVPPEEES